MEIETTVPLYSKYRPGDFSDFIGIEPILKILSPILKGKQLTPLLILGEYGSGKTCLADVFIKRLCCHNPDGINPCKNCSNCKYFESQRDNLFEGFRYHPLNINPKSLVFLDQGLIAAPLTITYSPFNRYLMIDEVDHCTKAVLKGLYRLIERHPASPFIFTATDISVLPKSLVSRCLQIFMGPYPEDILGKWAQEIIEKEGIVCKDVHEVMNLVRMTRPNFRSILNAIETLKHTGQPLTKSIIHSRPMFHNLSLSVGPKRPSLFDEEGE
jgi:DNA polymerase III subunit gamma/tau